MNTLKVAVVLVGSSLDKKAMQKDFDAQCKAFEANHNSAHDLIGEAVIGYLLTKPGMSQVTTETLVNRAYEAAVIRINADAGEGVDTTDLRDEALAMLKKRVPEYLRANPDLFQPRQKAGIQVHFVPGETDKDGNQVYRTDGETWQAILDKANAPKEPKAKTPASK
jgi:hypothetical protein